MPSERRNLLALTRDAVLVASSVTLMATPWVLSGGARRGASSIDLTHTLNGPSVSHPLGSDMMGRDLLLRFAEAVRDGVLPLWCGVALGAAVGLAVGLVAIGARRTHGGARVVVALIDAFAAALASVPVGVAAFAWAATFERAGLWPVFLTLSLLFGVRTYLQVRDLGRHDERLAYWQAHEALGGSTFLRLWRYGVLGSWRRQLVEGLCFHLSVAVAIEASLSYLGFGIQEPAASFGNMLAAHFDLYLKGHWEVLATILGVFAMTVAFPSALARLIEKFPRRHYETVRADALHPLQ